MTSTKRRINQPKARRCTAKVQCGHSVERHNFGLETRTTGETRAVCPLGSVVLIHAHTIRKLLLQVYAGRRDQGTRATQLGEFN